MFMNIVFNNICVLVALNRDIGCYTREQISVAMKESKSKSAESSPTFSYVFRLAKRHRQRQIDILLIKAN